MATSVADIRTVFRGLLGKFQSWAAGASQASQLQQQRAWCQPPLNGWSGDVFDLAGLSQAFDRSDNWNDYLAALKAGKGVVGDLQVSQLQGDWLSIAERAYRTRLMTRCRAEQHSASRLYGHGHPQGLFKKSILGYLQGIVKSAKNSIRT